MCGDQREGFLWPFWKWEAGTEGLKSMHTTKSVQGMFSCSLWSQLLTLPECDHGSGLPYGGDHGRCQLTPGSGIPQL